jgi:GxxExxY protein
MTDNEITREISGAAIEVHKLLGPGLLESAYEDVCAMSLRFARSVFKSKSRCRLYTKK